MPRVLVVDDHEIVRRGICRLLADAPGVQVVGEASSGEDALGVIAGCQPDVVLMDIHMPGIGGLEATRRVTGRFPRVKVVAVSVSDKEPFPSRLFEAGASGYISKGTSLAEMLEAIHTVAAGDYYIDATVTRSVGSSILPGEPQSVFAQLSARELQVALMLARGIDLAVIAQRLELSTRTVGVYRHRIFKKVGVASVEELARVAVHDGLLAN